MDRHMVLLDPGPAKRTSEPKAQIEGFSTLPESFQLPRLCQVREESAYCKDTNHFIWGHDKSNERGLSSQSQTPYYGFYGIQIHTYTRSI